MLKEFPFFLPHFSFTNQHFKHLNRHRNKTLLQKDLDFHISIFIAIYMYIKFILIARIYFIARYNTLKAFLFLHFCFI